VHIYNWYHSITTSIPLYTRGENKVFMYTIHSPCYFLPFCSPVQLTWKPPCCDRIRPPRSRVARKLTSPFSSLVHIPPAKNPDPPGFSRSKYTFIRTTLRTRPTSSRTVTFPCVTCVTVYGMLLIFSCVTRVTASCSLVPYVHIFRL
jgi:hypothetical protein